MFAIMYKGIKIVNEKINEPYYKMNIIIYYLMLLN